MNDIENKIINIEKQLHPIQAVNNASQIIYINEYEDFIQLSNNHTIFEEKSEQYANFFFANDGIIYIHTIGEYGIPNEESTMYIDKLDLTPITKDDLMEYSRIQGSRNETVYEQMNRSIDHMMWAMPYLSETDFKTTCERKFDKAVEKTITEVNSILKNNGVTPRYTYHSKDSLLREIICNNFDFMEIVSYQYADKLGKTYKENMTKTAKELVASYKKTNMLQKDIDNAVDNIYEKLNPDHNRGKYYIMKKDIERMFH